MKPSIPKGTRDFSPVEMAKRNYIFDTIKAVFRLYGFEQIETPAMENLSTLMGKYGEEGDKLLFKVLNSGDYIDALDAKTRGLNKKELVDLTEMNDEELTESISFVKQQISNNKYKSIHAIENEYYNYFINEKSNLGKFLFSSSVKRRTLKELKIYIQNLTEPKLRSYIISALRQSKLKNLTSTLMTPRVSEKGLRYDLTVPFARYVVQHQNDISFPFKRYQIQPVWRADRPQKGRYREFYQCDVDVVGSDSLLNEVELIQIVDEVYRRLNINVILKINNRKILTGIAEVIGQTDKIIDITVAIDKLDKIGLENVNKELQEKGITKDALTKLQPILLLKGSNAEKLTTLKTVLASSEVGLQGIIELETIFNLLTVLKVPTTIELDLTLARGLNYYTGAIFEVKAKEVEIGSITGGGRYDNLTGVFGLPGVSGVGISFGADRIYDVLDQLNNFPAESLDSTKLLFVTFGEDELLYCLPWAQALRKAGIPSEVYPEVKKMQKQMGYADGKKIPFVAIVGGDEMAQDKVMLKDMQSGEQILVTLEELLGKIS